MAAVCLHMLQLSLSGYIHKGDGFSKAAGSGCVISGLASYALLALMGCGGASSNSNPSPTPTPTGPVSGAEFLYGIGNQGSSFIGNQYEIYVSTIDPGSGTLGAPTVAAKTFSDISLPNLTIAPGLMVIPSTKYFYLVGQQLGETGIFAFSQTGSSGLLTPLPSYSPYPIVASLPQITGTTMDGQGRFVYLSDATYTGSTGQYTNRISAYSINSLNGTLQTGPVLNQTLAGELVVMGADPTGKFLYAYRRPTSPNTSYTLDVFSIDSGTGTLTEVPGAPYPLSVAANGSVVLPLNLFLNAAGNLLYVAAGVTSQVGSTPVATEVVYVLSVNSLTGALTATAGSPYPLNNASFSYLSLSPNGSLLYASGGNFPAYEASAYSVDSTTGAVSSSSISTAADRRCCNDLLDPSGSVLIDYAPYQIGGVSSFLANPVTGALTPTQGLANIAFAAAKIIRIP